MTELELLNEKNAPFLLQIDRSGVPVRFVEEVSYTIETAKYGNEHHLRGFCNAIRQDGQYVGILLIGQAIEDEADPAELKGRDYFRLIGFVIEQCCRGMGVGTEALKKALAAFDAVYGKKPLLLECHRENTGALRFYQRMGFRNTHLLHNEDYYLIRD